MTPSPQPESPEPLKVADELALVRSVLRGYPTSFASADALRALTKIEAAIQAARNEAEAMRDKAARYDWLSSKAYTEGRDGGTNGFWRLPFVDGWGCEYPSMREYHHATLDSAIDAALAANGKDGAR